MAGGRRRVYSKRFKRAVEGDVSVLITLKSVCNTSGLISVASTRMSNISCGAVKSTNLRCLRSLTHSKSNGTAVGTSLGPPKASLSG